jgi:AraC-like DNA-binding protein
MLKTTDNYAETTDLSPDYDVLGDVLNSLRITGSILLNDDYAPPWALSIPDFETLAVLLKSGSGVRVIAFHFVQRGYIEITGDDDIPRVVEAGEIVICFGGAAHTISQGGCLNATPVEELLTGGENNFKPSGVREVHSASLICGVFLMHDIELNPLYSSLPAFLHISPEGNNSDNVFPLILNRMVQEVQHRTFGSSYVVERLLEIVCAEALRSRQITVAETTGWLSGLRDPVVGRAIVMIHADPGARWSVGRLANGVAMSPSRFSARFTATLGISPMAYVARWRMNIACRRLQGTQQSINEIAFSLGYENLSAFSRTFKRHTGVTPATWRSSPA